MGPLLSPLYGSSEPPETHIYDECDEEQGPGSHLSICGPGVQVLGIASILLGEAGQIAGFSVQGWKKRGNSRILATRNKLTICVQYLMKKVIINRLRINPCIFI